MAKILKKTSFGLIRTNPRLTTNIKLVADTKDKIYLESIDADPLLSKSIYKGFEISNSGSYSFDVKRFFSQNGVPLPNDIVYRVFEEDEGLEIKNRYKNQYDFTYGFGFYPKNSRIYSEEYSMFAPIWLEPDNIPERFVIFKMDGPVSVNPADINYNGSLDNSPELEDLISNPSKFFDNYIKTSKIIKSFDLTEKSSLGKYIRNHVNGQNFPESSLYISFEKGNQSFWNGISYKNGGFCSISNDIYRDYVLVDKTITEADDFITEGFRRNSVICANIMNLEFLFDDEEQEKYSFSRYFGLYMSEVELGKFILDNNRLYEDKNSEITQYPKYEFNNVGSATNYKESQIQNNELGVKLYPKIKKLNGTNGIYSGRLLNYQELRNPRFGFVKDVKGNLYSISNKNNWNTLSDSDYLRLKNKKIDLLNFSGFESPFNFVEGISTTKFGRPSFSFKVIGVPTSGDEIRIQYTDWNSSKDKPNLDNYTIIADSSLPDGKSNGLLFSVSGNLEEIAKSISDSINNIKYFLSESDDTIFNSIYKGNEVFIYTKTESENWNKLKITLYSEAINFPFDITSVEKDAEFKNLFYQKGPVNVPINSLSPLANGWYVSCNFSGGNQNPKSRAIINKEDLFDFKNEDDEIFVKTKLGYDVIKDFGLYLDEPIYNDAGQIIDFKNIEKFYVINLNKKNDEFEFGSSSKISLSKLKKNTCGYLSVFPVKDFDFRYKSDEYNRSADSNPTKLWEWYKSITNESNPVFDYSNLNDTSKNFINEMIGPTSTFVLNGGFQTLNGYTDPIEDVTDSIFNEYDRLKENYISELSLSSKVVPFINKWVYDNESSNVREVPYRLNTNAAFGFSNFSPSFENIQRSTKFFTHEWYYLQKYPPYMSFDEKVNSFSYFDEDLKNVNLPEFPDPNSVTYQGINGDLLYLADKQLVETARMNLVNANQSNPSLYSIEYDYFLNYFTRETVSGFPIKRDFRYSLFSNGDSIKPAETLFRGIKVEIKDRTEFSDINFNKETLKYINNKKYNGYKFSCVLTYGNSGSQITVIKNDKFKSVTLVIQSDINDDLTTYVDSNGLLNRFIDRSHLYSISNILELNLDEPWAPKLKPKDKKLSGIIYDWIDEGDKFKVFFKEDKNGTIPQLFNEITINNNGTFNNVEVRLDTQGADYLYTFIGITKVEGSIFYCTEITGLPNTGGSIIPTSNKSNSLINIKNNVWGLVPTGIFMLPFDENPVYINGGDGGYLSLIDELSFSSISNRINSGDPEIKYINVTSQGNIELNTFVLDLIKPDYPVTSTYLKRDAIKKSSRDLQVNEAILGYEITALPRVIVNNITRYRGLYNPKFRDIINFIDTNDLKTEELDFLNIQILTKISDPHYPGIFYTDSDLGKILELYSNKVNVENPNIITSNSNFKDVFSVYPLIGEIAIDDDDFFIFKSNWDANYYKKYNKAKKFEYVIGTREPKEEKSFFGSKAISIPNTVRIEKFLGGYIEESLLINEFNSIDNTSYNIVKKSLTSKDKTEIILDVFVTKALEDWMLNDGISKDFIKYINPEYSFGDYGLTDDIRLYIRENLTQRYSIKEIIFWEKTYKFDKSRITEEQIVTGFSDPEKITNGYLISKDFKTITNVSGGLDFSLIYTLPKDRKTSIAITVVLEKK
jgi:hypothetical protein